MYEKITKKNSIIFNQMWINKIIEERHMELLPHRIERELEFSIGEIIEIRYLSRYGDINDNPIKISKSNSILLEQEWKEKFREERISLPIVTQTSKVSLSELMEQKYSEIKEIEKRKILKIRLAFFMQLVYIQITKTIKLYD